MDVHITLVQRRIGNKPYLVKNCCRPIACFVHEFCIRNTRKHQRYFMNCSRSNANNYINGGSATIIKRERPIPSSTRQRGVAPAGDYIKCPRNGEILVIYCGEGGNESVRSTVHPLDPHEVPDFSGDHVGHERKEHLVPERFRDAYRVSRKGWGRCDFRLSTLHHPLRSAADLLVDHGLQSAPYIQCLFV